MKSRKLKNTLAMIAAGIALATSLEASAQVAGTTTLGVDVIVMKDVTSGMSAKRQIMGKAVYNEKKEKIGTVDDLIVGADKAVSYAIIGAGGFLGLAKHDVVIPVNQFKLMGGKFVLDGATKEALKAMAPFKYAS